MARKACFVFTLFIFACSNNGGPDGGGKDDSSEPDFEYLPNQLPEEYAYITSPVGRGAYATNEASITVGGPGYAAEITWQSDQGSSGTVSATGNWEVDVPLEYGDNLVTITVNGTEHDRIVITRNDLLFDDPPKLDPREIMVNEPTEVTFRLRFKYEAFLDDVYITSGMSSLAPRVAQLDQAGKELATVCTMEDSGDANVGDEYAGDLIFVCKGTFNEATPGELYFRVVTEVSGSKGLSVNQSRRLILPVLKPLTLAEAERMDSLAKEAWTKYEQLTGADGHEAGARKAEEWLLAQTDVPYAAASEDGYTLSWEVELADGRRFKQGLGGGPPDTKTGPVVQKPSAWMFEAFYNEWKPKGNMSEDVKKAFQEPRCPKYDPIEVYNATLPQKADVAAFKKMDDHGVAITWTHGGLWNGTTPASNWSVIISDEISKPADVAAGGKYAADMAAQRLMTWTFPDGGHYSITYKFVEHYYNFDDTLVINGACHGFSDYTNPTNQLHKSFLKQGAAAFVSFFGAVSTAWSKSWTSYFIAELLEDFEELGVAYAHAVSRYGQLDPVALAKFKTVFVHIVYRTPSYEKMTLNWGCDGFLKAVTVNDQSTWIFHGQYKIKENSPGAFVLEERRAYCRYVQRKYSENQVGVIDVRKNRDWATGQGQHTEKFTTKPRPAFMGLHDEQETISFQSLKPPGTDWVKIQGGYSRQGGNGDYYQAMVDEMSGCGGFNGSQEFEVGGEVFMTDDNVWGTVFNADGENSENIIFDFSLSK